MTTLSPSDPFVVLGLSPNASEAEIRARYLELVKQHPPDHDPERFQEIRKAFEGARDPLAVAVRLTQVPDPDEKPPEWYDVLREAERRPPAMTPAFLFSLGNRASS